MRLYRIIQKGGYVSVNAGSAPEANSMLIGKERADQAMDAAACIGCSACVAACPNASASLFVSAKISQLAILPQGREERGKRALAMVAQMDEEGFGACSNHGECEAVCPKKISIYRPSQLAFFYLASLISTALNGLDSLSWKSQQNPQTEPENGVCTLVSSRLLIALSSTRLEKRHAALLRRNGLLRSACELSKSRPAATEAISPSMNALGVKKRDSVPSRQAAFSRKRILLSLAKVPLFSEITGLAI